MAANGFRVTTALRGHIYFFMWHHEAMMLCFVVSMTVICAIRFVLHVNFEWLSRTSVRVCVCVCVRVCVRLFSQLSHRSLRCLAGFYADGLINGWETLVLQYGCSPSCNVWHDETWHTGTHTQTHTHHNSHTKRERKHPPPTTILLCN